MTLWDPITQLSILAMHLSGWLAGAPEHVARFDQNVLKVDSTLTTVRDNQRLMNDAERGLIKAKLKEDGFPILVPVNFEFVSLNFLGSRYGTLAKIGEDFYTVERASGSVIRLKYPYYKIGGRLFNLLLCTPRDILKLKEPLSIELLNPKSALKESIQVPYLYKAFIPRIPIVRLSP